MSPAVSSIATVNASATIPAAALTAPAAADPDGGGLTFDDLLDIVNPLQHIPVVSTIYRAISGDTIKTFPKVAGDTLYGGVTGFLSSVGDMIFKEVTGKTVGDTVLGWAEDAFSSSPPTAVATEATPAAPQTASITAPSEDLGDRIVDWFEGLFSPSSPATPTAPATAATTTPLPVLAAPAATAAPTPLQTSANTDAIVVPGQDALLLSLSRNGVNNDVALRAADAYRRTLGVADTAVASALR